MGAKLERLGAELAKARKKKAEWDSRVKDYQYLLYLQEFLNPYTGVLLS